MRLIDDLLPPEGDAPYLKWRNPYDAKENAEYDELTAIHFTEDDGKTLQAPAEEQDINVLMQRFGIKDGSVLPYWSAPQELFGDFSNIPTDPVQVQEYIHQGNLAFMRLPADIRRRFENAPQLYNWLTDNKNTEEAVKMGLLEARKMPPTEPVSSNTSSVKEQLVEPPV